MAGWHHQFSGHELGLILRDDERQGGLACCSPTGHKESDTAVRLNNNNIAITGSSFITIS